MVMMSSHENQKRTNTATAICYIAVLNGENIHNFPSHEMIYEHSMSSKSFSPRFLSLESTKISFIPQNFNEALIAQRRVYERGL